MNHENLDIRFSQPAGSVLIPVVAQVTAQATTPNPLKKDVERSLGNLQLLPVESDDAQMTGQTRSLDRRLLALSLSPMPTTLPMSRPKVKAS
jgi:hypothetical protein